MSEKAVHVVISRSPGHNDIVAICLTAEKALEIVKEYFDNHAENGLVFGDPDSVQCNKPKTQESQLSAGWDWNDEIRKTQIWKLSDDHDWGDEILIEEASPI